MGMMSEFKAFALRGNVVDLAVGVIIGAAFGAIVSSAVSDIFMPVVGEATGGKSLKDKFIALDGNTYTTIEQAKAEGVGTINYGNLIDVTIKFIIVAFVLFMVIKAMNRLQRKEAVAPSVPPAPSKEEVLLTEIRDLLKRGAKA
jgi:large conductance mechanosensitive channel